MTTATAQGTFNPANHEYRIGDTVLDHATGVLRDLGFYYEGPMERKDGLPAFAVGIAAHKALEYYAQCRLDLSSVDSRIKGYVESGARWIDKYVVKVHSAEERFYHPTYLLGMQLDLRCKTRLSDRDLIVDHTVSAAAPAKRFQLGCYQIAYPDHDTGVLCLRPDGEIAKWVHCRNPNDTALFLSMLNTVRTLRAMNIKLQRRHDGNQ